MIAVTLATPDNAFELGTVYDNREEIIECCRELAEVVIKGLSATLVRSLRENTYAALANAVEQDSNAANMLRHIT